MEKIYEAIGTIIGTLVLFILSKKPLATWLERKRINKFRKGIDKTEKINQVLSEIKSRYGFNMVSIIDYHNGTTTFGGFSLKYGSMSFETCDDITKGIITEFQNIPCSLVSDMLVDLERNPDGYVIVTTQENSYSESVDITQTMYGVERAYNFRIGNSLINGCVSCVYTNSEYKKIKITEEDIQWIKAQILKIQLLREASK